jgi:hypothetical protein
MDNNTIQIDLGIKTYTINDACKVSFNPTDAAFVEKLYNTFDELDRKQEEYKAEASKVQMREVFQLAKKRDAEMREMVDSVLGDGVSDSLFAGMNIYAMSDGLPLWAVLLLEIMDKIDEGIATQQELTNNRIRKYSEKYKKNR